MSPMPPPKKTGLIRWAAVIPTTVLLLILVLFAVFLVDPLAKRALIAGGEAVFGAKVDIERVRVGFRDASLTIRGLAVADQAAPMTNLFEWSEAVFDARFLPLLEKKVVIENASVTGLRFGTPRKSSGALLIKPAKPGVVSKAVDRVWSQVETVALDKWGDIVELSDPKTVINPDALNITAEAKRAQAKWQAVPDDLKKQVTAIDAPGRIDRLRTQLDAVSRGPSDPAALVEKARAIKEVQSEISRLKSDLLTTERAVQQTVADARGQLSRLQEAKEADWQKLRSTLSLPAFDADSLIRALIGPSVARFMERTVTFSHQAKAFMPASGQKPPPPARGKGRVIEFPRLNDWPRFTLVRSELSGEWGRETPLQFKGTLSGVTTNPPLYGRPMVLALEGREKSRALALQATVDARQSVWRQSLEGFFSGFAIRNQTLGQPGSLAIVLAEGVGRLQGRFSLQGDALNGNIQFFGTGMRLVPDLPAARQEVAQRFQSSLVSSLSRVRTLEAQASFGGTLQDPSFKVGSNLGPVLAQAARSAVGDELARQEQSLRAELDRQADRYIYEFAGRLKEMEQTTLGPLAAQSSAIDALARQAQEALTRQSGGKALDSIRGLFRK